MVNQSSYPERNVNSLQDTVPCGTSLEDIFICKYCDKNVKINLLLDMRTYILYMSPKSQQNNLPPATVSFHHQQSSSLGAIFPISVPFH